MYLKVLLTAFAVLVIGIIATGCSDQISQSVSGHGVGIIGVDGSATEGAAGGETQPYTGETGTQFIDGEQVPDHCPAAVYPSCPVDTTIRSDCSCESRLECACVWPSSS